MMFLTFILELKEKSTETSTGLKFFINEKGNGIWLMKIRQY